MTPVDWMIVVIFALSVLTAFINGFFVEVCSLGGLVLGVELGATEYPALTPWLARWIDSTAARDATAFLLIAILVMVAAGLLGRIFRLIFRRIGLGWLDRLAGAAFGVLKGCILVTIVLMALLAFFPGRPWLRDSQLAPSFVPFTRGGVWVVPGSLGEKISRGLRASSGSGPAALGFSHKRDGADDKTE